MITAQLPRRQFDFSPTCCRTVRADVLRPGTSSWRKVFPRVEKLADVADPGAVYGLWPSLRPRKYPYNTDVAPINGRPQWNLPDASSASSCILSLHRRKQIRNPFWITAFSSSLLNHNKTNMCGCIAGFHVMMRSPPP